MTFKHKLSHRLALLRSAFVILTVSVGACSEGDLGSLAPYDDMDLAGERIASISPKAVVIEADQPVKFKSTSDSPEAVKWRSTGGKITSEGTFSSPSEGEYLVVSSVSLSGGERTDTARVRVVRRGDGRQLTVSPRSVELNAGQSAHFNIAAVDADGAPIEVKVNWKVAGGTIDRDGNFLAGSTPGAYSLIAFSPGSGLADTVSITVKASTRQVMRFLLAPATASVIAGGAVKYTASAQYEDGSTEPVAAQFSTGSGTISPTGELTAGNQTGEFKVTARSQDGALQATSTLTVTGVSDPVPAPVDQEQPAPAPVGSTDPPSPEAVSGSSNEPSGYTRFAELRFGSSLISTVECSALPSTGTGCWGRWGVNESMVKDPTAPFGPDVMQITFPRGLEPGYGENGFWGWTKTADGRQRQYREVYEQGWVKLPGNDFETQLTGVKILGYWGVGDPTTTRPVQLFMGFEGNGTHTAPLSSWRPSMLQQNIDNWRRDPNMNSSKSFVAGKWVKYEILMKLNDVGRNNGVLKIWLDGVQITEYADVPFRNAANPSGFFGRNFHPIWGGVGGGPKSRDDHLWISRVYISGIPL